MAVRCRYFGNWTFGRHSKMGKAEICPEVFRSELVEVYLSLDAVEHFTDLDFDLFGFGTSRM
jgi:hypothetical protein